MGADQPVTDKDAHLDIGYLTATASDDLTMLMDLCERTSTSKSAAKEAAKALRQEFKCACVEYRMVVY